jgi:hypothetical protein
MNGNTAHQAAMTLAGTGPTTVKADQTRAFEPRSIDEGYDLAKLLVASGLLGRNIVRPEQAFTIIATGRELGLTAMQSLRSIHIIEGKPTLSADLIAALCKSRPDVCQYFQMVESTDKVARYETHRKGDPKPTTMSFSIEDAQRAGVTGKDNWKKYPAAMLRARCITALARAVYPDLAMGLYDSDSEEVEVPATPRRGGYEVVPPAPEPVADLRVFQELCDKVDAAESVGQLNAAAAATGKAHKAKQISAEQFATIGDAVKRKRTLIGAPKPPKSEPGEKTLQAIADTIERDSERRDADLESAIDHEGGEPGEEG